MNLPEGATLITEEKVNLPEGATLIEDSAESGLLHNNDDVSLIQGEEPSFTDKAFDRLFSAFQDPEKEKAKAVQALVDSEALGIAPSSAYRYRDQIDDGVKLNPMAVNASRRTTLTERVNQSWETGKAQVQQGLLASKFLINGDMAAYDEALKIKYPEYDFISEGRIESAVRAAAKMLPMTVDVGKEFFSKGLPVGMGAGATVAILGQLGPQAALPEEVVTVPAATALGFKAGGTAAAYKRVMELEGGLAVMELMNLEDAEGNKLDPNTVRATGLGIGAVNGLIELAQIKLLLKTVPGLEKVLGKAIIDTLSSKTLKERLAKTAVKYGGVVLAETGQELGQESTNIIAEALAIELNNAAKGTDIPQATLEEILDRYYEVGSESAQAFMVTALPGSMATAAYKGGNKPKKVNPSKPPVQDSPIVKQAQDTVQAYNGKKPIILGVDETVVDGENVITSFTMADPITGDVFTVPASQKIQDDTVSYMPDQTAINDRLEKTASDDLDAQIDRMIEGDDTAIEQVFGKEADVPNFEAENDLTPAEKVDSGANMEPLIAEARKYKTAEEFVNSIGEDLYSLNKEAKKYRSTYAPTQVKNKLKNKILNTLAEETDTFHVFSGGGMGQLYKLGNETFHDLIDIGKYNIRTNPKLRESRDNLYNYIIKERKDIIDDINNVGKGFREEFVNKQLPDGLKKNDISYSDREYGGLSVDINGHVIYPKNDLKLKELLDDFINNTKGLPLSKEELNLETITPPTENLKKPFTQDMQERLEYIASNNITKADLTSIWNKAQEGNILDTVKAINDTLGEKGSIDLEPIVNLGRSIIAEGHKTYEAFTARAKEVLGEVWEKVKELVEQAWNKLKEERGSLSNKDVKAFIETPEGQYTLSLMQQELQAGEAGLMIEEGVYGDSGLKSVTGKFSSHMPWARAIMQKHKVESAYLNNIIEKYLNGKELTDKQFKIFADIRRAANKQNYTIPEEISQYQEEIKTPKEQENVIAEFKKLAEMAQQERNQKESLQKTLKELRAINNQLKGKVYFSELNKEQLKERYNKLRNNVKWMAQRKSTLKNVRDYFGLTDNDMSKISRKNPLLMDEQEFAQYLKDVNLKAIDLKDNKWAKIELMKLIEDKRLQKVDNYRRALELPSIDKMTTEQLRQFAQLLEPFQNDDVFMTQRELETVDKTDLKGIRTWREARERFINEANEARVRDGKLEFDYIENMKIDEETVTKINQERADKKKQPFKNINEMLSDKKSRDRLVEAANAKRTGKQPIEYIMPIKVAWNALEKGDTFLREQDPFFERFVTDINAALIKRDLNFHNTESEIYDLAKKADKSRKRGIIERMIPQDEITFDFLEAPSAQKNAVAQQMTPEQLRLAHYMNQFFSNAEDYLKATKIIERGRSDYITHIRKTFMENMRDKSAKDAILELFSAYQEDEIVWNILDDTGNILPLEKFIPYALHRTGELDPTKNVVRAFLTYAKALETKKAFDSILSKWDIYTQALTPTKYTPRGLEIDRSLKNYVNTWINNKKGRRHNFGGWWRQGSKKDLTMRALRTITTMIDLGLYVPAQAINFMGEQITTMVPLGYKDYAKSIALMRTDKGKRILKKYEFFTERSLWEEFTAPGKEIQQRLMDGMFGLFHISSVAANKQFLLASMTKEEWANEELSPERLAQIKLDMGKFRAIPGMQSIVGSTSVGSGAMQYKRWAAPIVRRTATDLLTMAKHLHNKQYGSALTCEEAREIYRIVGTTIAITTVLALSGDDEDDDQNTFIGKMYWRAKREVYTLTQGLDPRFWLMLPRTGTWLYKLSEAMINLATFEEYKTKEGYKGVDQLKRAVTPGLVRALPDKED